MSEMVERAARLLVEDWGLNWDRMSEESNAHHRGRVFWRQRAGVIIAAMRQSTHEMDEAGQYTDYAEFYINPHDAAGVWERMIDAALK